MPGFTVGALAPWIETDLHVSRSTVGLAMSAFYAATALGSPLTQRIAAHLPVPAVLAVAALVASATMLVTSRTAGFATVLAALTVGGFSNGLVQPAAGLLIAATVPACRCSLAAGLVGAALGAATFASGLLVALVVQPHGWRTAMLVAGLLALVPAIFTRLTRIAGVLPVGRVEAAGQARKAGPVLALWALAAALSATGNNAVASYFIQLGTHSGLAATLAGNLLSASALIAIAVRITDGALTDRAPHRNPTVIAAMMITGAIGLNTHRDRQPGHIRTRRDARLRRRMGLDRTATGHHLAAGPDRAENAGHTVQVGVYTGATIAIHLRRRVQRVRIRGCRHHSRRRGDRGGSVNDHRNTATASRPFAFRGLTPSVCWHSSRDPPCPTTPLPAGPTPRPRPSPLGHSAPPATGRTRPADPPRRVMSAPLVVH